MAQMNDAAALAAADLGAVRDLLPGEGAAVHARDPLRGASVQVLSCNPVHYDPHSRRMKS